MYASLLAVHYDGLEEFVLLALCVPLLDGLDRICTVLAFTLHHAVEAHLNPLPPLVSVHDVVSSHDRSDFGYASHLLDLRKQLLHISRSALWVRVSPVPEEMDVYLGYFHLFRDLQEGKEMFDVAVNTAITYQTQEM